MVQVYSLTRCTSIQYSTTYTFTLYLHPILSPYTFTLYLHPHSTPKLTQTLHAYLLTHVYTLSLPSPYTFTHTGQGLSLPQSFQHASLAHGGANNGYKRR